MHITIDLTPIRSWIEQRVGAHGHVTSHYDDGQLAWISTRPTTDGPCPFTLTAQGDDRISIVFGVGSVHESWVRTSSEADALLDDVRRVVDLLINGRVVEKTWHKHGRLRKIRATFAEDDGPWHTTTVPLGGRPGPAIGTTTTVDYLPYVIPN